MNYRKYIKKIDEGIDSNEQKISKEYQKKYKDIQSLIKQLNKKLTSHSKQDNKNWGHIGDLDYVQTTLFSLVNDFYKG